MSREVDNLLFIRQQDKELLKDCVAWFMVATLKVYHLDESIAMLALKWGLCPSHLTYSLDKISIKSYSEMLVHAQKYIHKDEGALSTWGRWEANQEGLGGS